MIGFWTASSLDKAAMTAGKVSMPVGRIQDTRVPSPMPSRPRTPSDSEQLVAVGAASEAATLVVDQEDAVGGGLRPERPPVS